MPVFCSQCGAQNLDVATFCDQCGNRLKKPQAPPPASERPSAVIQPAPAPAPAAQPKVEYSPVAPPPAAQLPDAQPPAGQPPSAQPAVVHTPVAPPPSAPVRPADPPPKGTSVMPPGDGHATRPLIPDSGPLPGPVAKLVVLQGGQPVREHAVIGISLEVGRWDPANGAFPEIDLTDDDPLSQVSRRHARIFREDDSYFLEDKGSTNGTYVARQKLAPGTPVKLEQGAEIILGRTFLRFLRLG